MQIRQTVAYFYMSGLVEFSVVHFKLKLFKKMCFYFLIIRN